MSDTHPPSSETQPARRRWERLAHAHRLVLELPGLKPITGVTRDVSLNGVLLVADPEYDLDGVLSGARGVLKIADTPEGFSFPCQVVRVTSSNVALNLFDKQAAFGMAITHDIFSHVGRK